MATIDNRTEDRVGDRYVLGPRSERGLLAGRRARDVVVLAMAGGAAVLALRRMGGAWGLLGALVFLSLGTMAVALRVAGRPALEWLPVLSMWAARRISGRRVLETPATRASLWPPEIEDVAESSGVLRGISLVAVEDVRAGALGLLVDRAQGVQVAVLELESLSLALADPIDRHARVRAWGRLLAAVSQESAISRLQWLVRVLPSSLQHLPAPPGTGPQAASESYRKLLEERAPSCWRRQALLAVVVRARPSGRVGSRGGEIIRSLAVVRRELENAGFGVSAVLGARSLAASMRCAWAEEAWCRRHSAGRQGDDNSASAWPWPQVLEESWDACRVDGTWHAVYWVAEWPRRPVKPDFLTPLVMARCRRTISVVMEPVPRLRALRQAERARTDRLADDELRRRSGFTMSTRLRRQAEALAQRERELADGHAQYRFAAYVSVAAGDSRELAEECSDLEAAAARAQIELVRCYGDTASAFSWTLPLGRGL